MTSRFLICEIKGFMEILNEKCR